MIYPKWLPSPKCWLKSLELMFWTSVNFFIGYCLFWVVSIFFSFPLMLIVSIFEGEKPDILTMIFAVIVTIVYGFIFIIFPIFIFAHIHQSLWSDPHPKFPKWLPAKRNLLEGFLQYLFFFVATILVIAIALPFVLPSDPITSNQVLDRIIPYLITLQITIIAYLYHFKYWLKRKADRKKANQEKSVTK